MLSVSTTATWSRMAVIHARCDQHFLGFHNPFFLLSHVHRVHYTATAVVRLRVACLLQFDKMPDEGDSLASGDTRVGRHRFAVRDGFGAVPAQAGRDPTPGAPWGCAGSTAPRTCLSALAPSTTLSPSVAAGSPHGPWHPGPHVLVQPVDVILRAEVPASLQALLHEETHGTRQAPLRRPAANQVPASPPGSPPRPRLAERRPRDRRRPGGGPCPLHVLLHEKALLVPGGEVRKALCTNKPPLTVYDERSSHNRRERHFRNPMELVSLIRLEPLPAHKCDIFVKVAFGRRAATGSPLTTL